jgi:hypothetical protein
MTIVLKIIALSLAVIAVSKSYLDYRKKLEPKIMFIFWLIVWTGASILATYPILIERINIYTRDNTVTIGSVTSVAFIFMLFIVYRVYAKAARIEYQLTQLVRRISLEDNTKHKQKK